MESDLRTSNDIGIQMNAPKNQFSIMETYSIFIMNLGAGKYSDLQVNVHWECVMFLCNDCVM